MSKDLVLKRYFTETTPAVILVIVLALIATLVCIFVQAHWSYYAMIGATIALNLALYADFIRRIRNGTFGSTKLEREALNQWFGHHGGTKIDGMHLPG